MPIQETFWAPRFGMLVDQFGTPWMVNCEKAKEASASGKKPMKTSAKSKKSARA